MGMSEEFLDQIFEPFSRASDGRVNRIQGTGLGMPISRNIVRMMGGDIKVESTFGKGSRFTVTIYLKLQENVELHYDKFIDLDVLVADDDALSLESCCGILNDFGKRAKGVSSGREAVASVVEHHEQKRDYFACIIDWKMPDMDGIETTKAIRKAVGKGVPIIIISAYDWSDIEQEAGAAGEGDNLGLQNFSLEVFRQDLLDYFEKHRDRFRQMPAGIFSGFRVEPTLFDEMPESLVAVLGYPRRKPGDVRTPYKRLYLMMQPVGPTPPTWQELSTGAILNLLRQNKAAPTCLPEGIAKGDLDTLQSLSCAIQAWIGARKPKEVYNALESLFNGQTSAKPVEERLEDIFRLESFDLVAWEYVSN